MLALRGGGKARLASRALSPSPTAQQLRSPFTGEPVRSLNRVLAVKIDNIGYARPQTGLTRADIVYVLPVEGGLSRFLAVFSSHYPAVIGPVRSAREDDLELLRQFGLPRSPTRAPRPRCCPTFTGPPGSRTSTTASPPATIGTPAGWPRTTCTPAPGNCCGKLPGEHGP